MGQANAVGPTSIEGSSFSSNYISTLHAVGDLWSVAVYRRCQLPAAPARLATVSPLVTVSSSLPAEN